MRVNQAMSVYESFYTLLKSSMFAFIVLLSLPQSAIAAVDIFEFDTDSQRERYHALNEVLRCPKCQNQNLAGSNSEISEDLRRELHRLMIEGKSDKEIKAFMVARYGDFVLYKTPLKSTTIALWLIPVALILGGAISLLLIVRQRAKVAVMTTNNSLSEIEQKQLNELLTKTSAKEATLANNDASVNKDSSAP
jgi:cytochrome c-type biogenesis protein CcmH